MLKKKNTRKRNASQERRTLENSQQVRGAPHRRKPVRIDANECAEVITNPTVRTSVGGRDR